MIEKELISDEIIIKLCFSRANEDKALGIEYLYNKYPKLYSFSRGGWVSSKYITDYIKNWPEQHDNGRWSTPLSMKDHLNL